MCGHPYTEISAFFGVDDGAYRILVRSLCANSVIQVCYPAPLPPTTQGDSQPDPPTDRSLSQGDGVPLHGFVTVTVPTPGSEVRCQRLSFQTGTTSPASEKGCVTVMSVRNHGALST